MYSNTNSLPLRATSAITLGEFFDRAFIRDLLLPNLGNLLNSYIQLMSIVDMEEVVYAVCDLVKYYEDLIRPYAIALITELIKTFKKFGIKSDEECKKGAMEASFACLDTIHKIISLIKDNTQAIV